MPGFELIGKEERDAVLEIFDKYGGVLFRHGFESLRNNSYKAVEFERAFAGYLGAPYAQAVTSGTVALKVALQAFGIGRGDEVITQSFTFVATVEAILDCGAKPILTEINETLNMDPADLAKKITRKTKIVIPVHMFGAAAQMDEILSIARRHKLPVLEDTAQGLGATYKGKKLGTLGDAGTFSFDFGKALTTGEGGMIVTCEKEIYHKVREYVDHGHQNNPNFSRGQDTRRKAGFNYRITELQGAIGLAQLAKLDYALRCQRENKQKIKQAIKDIDRFRFRSFADEVGETADTLVLFFESEKLAQEFVKGIRSAGFSTKNLPDAFNWHFAGTWDHIFKETVQFKNGLWKNPWKNSERLLRRTVALPISIKMPDNQINNAVEVLREVAKKL
jgi:8-amino-3,8-dideoxy-alpha-D-manno-octulosonate transaminase